MNLLEHYIVEIYLVRELDEKEKQEFENEKLNPNDWVYVEWLSNCYGSKKVLKDYELKSRWKQGIIDGYLLM